MAAGEKLRAKKNYLMQYSLLQRNMNRKSPPKWNTIRRALTLKRKLLVRYRNGSLNVFNA
jgi:hypothetical protein